VGKPIPSPENSSGPHATGIAVTLSLLRGFESRAAKHSPVLSIEFRIWGERERGAFCELLADYRRLIELGLAKHEFEFLTTCCFENIDRYTGTNAFKRLELYAANVHDPEWNFALSSSFHAESDLSEVTGALLILVVLYDACFGYCRKRKERDRWITATFFEKCREEVEGTLTRWEPATETRWGRCSIVQLLSRGSAVVLPFCFHSFVGRS
jgi:hypothetical protein